MFNKRLYIILGVIFLVIVLAIVGKKQGWYATDAISVEFDTAKRITITEKVSASGKIYPEVEVKLSPDVSGEITELLVKEGDSVVQGQLLLKIRPDIYQTAVERSSANLSSQKAALEQANARLVQAKAQLVRAKTDFARQKKLFDDKIISEQEFQAAQTSYEVAEAEFEAAKNAVESARYVLQSAQATLREAQTNLSLTAVYATQSGIISALNVEQGERVVGTAQMAGTELLRIAEFDNMEVRVNVNENDIIRISMDDTVFIEVDAYPEKRFRGKVTSIAKSANNIQLVSADAVTEFEVKIRMDRNSYQDLLQTKKYPFLPGMTASVEIITNTKPNALAVPLAAVTVRKASELNKKTDQEEQNSSANKEEVKKEVVFVREGKNKVRLVEVKTGLSDFEHIEILSGISEGDEVVVGPYTAISKTLEDGSIVKVAKEKKR